MSEKQMTWKKAITTVLSKASGAMHYTDIADEILERGLRTNVGATPATSVNIAINRDTKSRGDQSQFVKVGSGQYMLRSQAARGPEKPPLGEAAKPEEEEEEAGLISAFGMFWRADYVNWTTQPKLLGQQSRGAEEVDFGGQLGVYLLHDRARVVYVGRASDQPLGKRLSQHMTDRLNGRWDKFSWFGVLDVTEDGKLVQRKMDHGASDWIAAMEALLIEALEPPQNRRRGDDLAAVEYLQVKDPELDKIQKQALFQELMKGIGS